ncbi:MAG TPA: hypothetical protein VJP59_11545 [Gemmatimonadota bacterium]|nr:hypothetical protein [Gemmatimonadota bacterium]
MNMRRFLGLTILIAAGLSSPVHAWSETGGSAIQDTSKQRVRVQPSAPPVRGRAPVTGRAAVLDAGGIPKLPDLVVEGPVVTEIPPVSTPGQNIVWHWKRHEWTVRNLGPGDAPSSALRLRCQDGSPPEEAYCAAGDHNWANFPNVPIPPLAPGGSYKVSSDSYVQGGSSGAVMVFQEVKSEDPAAPGKILPYAIRFTAAIDPDDTVDELNESNNQTKYDDAVGKTFGAKVAFTPPKPSALRADPSQAPSMLVPGGPQILPVLSLSTEKTWTPGTSMWLLAKNVGGFAAPPSQVKGECVNLTNVEKNKAREEALASIQEQIAKWQKSDNPYAFMYIQQLQAAAKLIGPPLSTHCSFAVPAAIPVPALQNGESQGIFFLKTLQSGDDKYRISFQPPKGEALVLQN